MSTHANMVKMTVSSVGADPYTITLNAASSGFQSFADAYGANATVDILITQGTVWEVARNCTYTHSGTTVTRGTFEDSSTGSRITTFDNTAVVSVVATADLGNRTENLLGSFGNPDEIAVTGAVTATIGRMHHCTGTSADYTVTLPAASGNSGKLIGFRMGSASGLTKFVTLDGNASETIDGATTRVMWSGETAILLCDGSNWFKIAGKTIPMTAAMSRNSAQSITQSSFTKVNLDDIDYDPAGICDNTTDYDMTVKRTAIYELTGTLRVENGASITGYVLIYKDGTEILRNSILAIYPNPQLSRQASIAAGAVLTLYCYHTSASAQDVSYNATIPCTMSIVEVPTW